MQVYEYVHEIEYFESRILDKYVGGMRLGVFDIETLGLSPKFAPMILAGVMSVKSDGTCVVKQFFCENSSADEERELLCALRKELAGFDIVLTYNGRYFDMPYVRERAVQLGLAGSAEDAFKLTEATAAAGAESLSLDAKLVNCEPFNLDLLLFLRYYSGLKDALGKLNQKNVERYMGLEVSRDDEISGGDSVLMYKEFEKCEDAERKAALREKILLHNHDDLLQLYKIFPVILQSDIHKGMNRLGFPVKGEHGWGNFHVKKIKISASGLVASGSYCGLPESFYSYATPEQPYSATLDADHNFTLEFSGRGLKAALADPREINEFTQALIQRFMRDN